MDDKCYKVHVKYMFELKHNSPFSCFFLNIFLPFFFFLKYQCNGMVTFEGFLNYA